MDKRTIKDSIQVEWVNVTYRSVLSTLAALVLLIGGGGGYWFYFHVFIPKHKSTAAIQRAEDRLNEARAQVKEERVAEILVNAEAALDEARNEFRRARYKNAKITAIRSENLSLKAISLSVGDETEARLVRFHTIEGDVRIKQAGGFSWKKAELTQVLRIGDQVKTSSHGSAKLIYFDGTVTSIQPGSLLEIRDLYEDPVTKVRRVREKLSWGELESSTQARNVSGSYHEVATDRVSARTEEASEFRVTFDRERKVSVVDVFDGQIEVATDDRRETVDAGERIQARADGRLSAKQALPGVPRLLQPSDERVFIFESPEDQSLTLAWEALTETERYRLVIADQPLFSEPLYDATRAGESATIDGIPEGAYFWRVAALGDDEVQGPFSAARRFRVSSKRIRDRTDTEPPRLEISEFVPIGKMIIINGETEPGATLWVDNTKIDVYDDGSFNAVVRLREEGANELILVAQDTAGNETHLTRTAYVETF